MSLFDKFDALAVQVAEAERAATNPFSVVLDHVLSPTEAMIKGRRALLLGTNNYLGLTYDPDVIAKSAEAVREYGTGTTGSRIANGSYDGHQRLERVHAREFHERWGYPLGGRRQCHRRAAVGRRFIRARCLGKSLVRGGLEYVRQSLPAGRTAVPHDGYGIRDQ